MFTHMKPLLPVALAFAIQPFCLAETISISSVSATHDQGAPYDIAKAIDGSIANNFGWGVFNGQFTDQTAIFTTANPFSASTLAVGMSQFFGSDHYIQKFRLSVTTDAVPALNGVWSELAPSAVLVGGGPTATVDGANTVLATGSAPGLVGYRLLATGAFSNVTGVRLEAFVNDYDPSDALPPSLGRGNNGNFVLTELTLQTGAINFALGMPARSSALTFAGFPAINLVDGTTSTLTHPDNPPAQNGFFYEIDLGGVIDMSSIEIVNREDGCCPERLTNYRVQVLDADGLSVWSGNIRADGSNSGVVGVDSVTAASGAGTFQGRYVRVENISGDAYNPQASEVRVFGTAIPEPGVGLLSALGLLGLLGHRRRG